MAVMFKTIENKQIMKHFLMALVMATFNLFGL
jgi:hypothetical protein